MLAVNNYRPLQMVGDRKVLEVLTVQTLEKGSQMKAGSSGSSAGRARTFVGLTNFCMVIMTLTIVYMKHFCHLAE